MTAADHTRLWQAIGEIDEEENSHVLTKLFTLYEEAFARDPESEAVATFFKYLDIALTQTRECNLNRR
jgi:hypothetical protein